MKRPLVVGLQLCQRLGFNPQQGEVSLVGLFHALRFRTFPSPPQRFAVYVALYDGEGEGTMELVLTRPLGERCLEIFRMGG